jgi:hypothetical protein
MITSVPSIIHHAILNYLVIILVLLKNNYLQRCLQLSLQAAGQMAHKIGRHLIAAILEVLLEDKHYN